MIAKPAAVAQAAAAAHRPLAGIALRLMAMAALGIMFALVKLTAERGVGIVESAFYRHAFALPLIIIWVMVGPGFRSLATDRIGAHLARAVIGLSAMVLNFLGMIMLPLAEATVIGFATPLFATLMAALLLGEPTGRWRWGALVIGFAGVLAVIQPGSSPVTGGLGNGVLVALAGAVATAAVTILIRQLGATEQAATTVFWFTALSLVPLGALMLVHARSHDAATWGMIAGIGLSGGLAQLCLTGALRLAPVAVVLPMDYTGLLWASLFGWMLFGAVPASATLLGAPLIIASGLIILWREQLRESAATATKAQADAPGTG